MYSGISGDPAKGGTLSRGLLVVVVRFILKIPTDAVPQRQNSVGALGNAGQHVIESHH